MNCYQILGISPDAGEQEIKQSYKVLARKYHPDANPGDRAAEERFKEVAEAYQTLIDPEKKKQYDEYRNGQQGEARKGKRSGAGSHGMGAEPNIGDFIKNMDSYFGFQDIVGKKGDAKQQRKGTGKSENPVDVTEMFEKYMGFK